MKSAHKTNERIFHFHFSAFIKWPTVYLYICTRAHSTPQVHNLISSMTGVTSRPGKVVTGNTAGMEETICGCYSCRPPLVNALSSFLRHLASYEVSGEAIVCFVIMKFIFKVSNTY